MDTLSAISGFQTPHLGTARPNPSTSVGDSTIGATDIRQAGQQAGLTEATARGVQSTQDAAQTGSDSSQDPADKQPVEQAVKDINDFFQTVRRTLQFNLDQDSGKMVIQIKDAETDQVIRQIPPEYVLRLAKQLGEVKGLLFEEKA